MNTSEMVELIHYRGSIHRVDNGQIRPIDPKDLRILLQHNLVVVKDWTIKALTQSQSATDIASVLQTALSTINDIVEMQNELPDGVISPVLPVEPSPAAVHAGESEAISIMPAQPSPSIVIPKRETVEIPVRKRLARSRRVAIMSEDLGRIADLA